MLAKKLNTLNLSYYGARPARVVYEVNRGFIFSQSVFWKRLARRTLPCFDFFEKKNNLSI